MVYVCVALELPRTSKKGNCPATDWIEKEFATSLIEGTQHHFVAQVQWKASIELW